MIEKVVKKYNLKEFSEIEENLAYWLTKTPEERVSALEKLRKQHVGGSERLQRVVRIVKRKLR